MVLRFGEKQAHANARARSATCGSSNSTACLPSVAASSKQPKSHCGLFYFFNALIRCQLEVAVPDTLMASKMPLFECCLHGFDTCRPVKGQVETGMPKVCSGKINQI